MKTVFAIVTLAVLLLAGLACERDIESSDPIRTLPGAPPTPDGVEVRLIDRAARLVWSVDDPAGVAEYRVYRAPSPDSVFTLHGSTTETTLLIDGLAFDQTWWLRVAAVGTNGIEGDQSDPVDISLGLFSIEIAGGNDYTRTREVQVQLIVPAPAAFVELSEDHTFSDSPPVLEFRTSLDFELSDGDGVKRVWARVTFEDGSFGGDSISDAITLDTEARIDSVYFLPAGQVFEVGDTITFYLATEGEVEGDAAISFGGPDISLYDDGSHGDAGLDDGLYTSRFIIPEGVGVFDALVTGEFTDAAGNRATNQPAEQRLDIRTESGPEAVTLAVSLTDAETAHLSWTESDHLTFESYRIYRSVSQGIPDQPNDNLRIAILSSSSTTSFEDFLATSGTYYYRVFVLDGHGRLVGSNEVGVAR